MQELNLLPAGLVLGGVALLIASLRPACRICSEAVETGNGWRGLAALIVGFIVGYIAYDVSLLRRDIAPIDYVIATIFFLGGVFVLVVSRLSMLTIREVRRITALERHRASHDGLTGLPNRCHFSDRVSALIRRDADRGVPGRFSVLIMDLDRFKTINDTLGHDYGDRLLRAVSARLEDVLHEPHLLARLGGDEFGIIIDGLSGSPRIMAIAERIRTALHEPFAIDGHTMDTGVSVGMAFYPEHGSDAGSLMRRAEIAMYAAKKMAGHSTIYTPELERDGLSHLSLLGELRGAIDADALELVFHPQLDLGRGEISGLEALVRWPGHEGGRTVLPDEFVPLAEQTGMIVQLDRWVISRVARYLRGWEAGAFGLTISTNISARSLCDPAFLDFVIATFRDVDLSPQALMLEITESAVMADPEQAMRAVTRLTRMGFGFAIDDFGTGYSSLAYLKRLPASEIKIDKSFVTDMSVDENDAVIVRSTIDLAHNMGRRVVAEGVENQDTLDLLTILGCDYAQGFFISQPLAADGLHSWLRRYRVDREQRAEIGSVAPI